MLTGRVYYGGTELTRILLFLTLQCCIMAQLGVCVPSNNSVSQASPNRRELHMKNSFPLSIPQPRHVTVYKVIHRKALKKKKTHYTTNSHLVPQLSSAHPTAVLYLFTCSSQSSGGGGASASVRANMTCRSHSFITLRAFWLS